MEQQGLIILKQSISCFLSIPFHSFPFCFVLPYLPQARSARSSEMQQGRFRSIRHCATVAGLGLVDGLQQQCLGPWPWISSISSMVTTWHCGITQWISMVASGCGGCDGMHGMHIQGATRSRAFVTPQNDVWPRLRCQVGQVLGLFSSRTQLKYLMK